MLERVDLSSQSSVGAIRTEGAHGIDVGCAKAQRATNQYDDSRLTERLERTRPRVAVRGRFVEMPRIVLGALALSVKKGGTIHHRSRAANDASGQLRFPAGADAVALAQSR